MLSAMGSRGPYAYTVDEEATGSLVQATQQDCHWGFKPGWLPPKLVSVHGGKGSRSSGLSFSTCEVKRWKSLISKLLPVVTF